MTCVAAQALGEGADDEEGDDEAGGEMDTPRVRQPAQSREHPSWYDRHFCP